MTTWWPHSSAVQEFVAPAAIHAGRGGSARLGAVLAADRIAPGAAVAVVVDDVVHRMGALEALLDGLGDAGYSVTVIGGVGSEPDDAVIDEAAATARRIDAEAVIGVGGGSVLDTSKLLALLVRNEGRVADWLGAVDPPRGTVPLYLVPTTCGTGSEANRHALVTVDGAKRWSSFAGYVARAVVLDAELLDGLPGPLVASTGMDALAHAVESAMSTTASPMTLHHALRAIELVVEHLEAAVGGDPAAREACAWGSHLAGQSLNAGVLLGHSLAYSLAHAAHIPHGVSSGFALPYCIAYNAGHLDPARAAVLARALTAGRSAALEEAAAAVQRLAARVGQPTTSAELAVPADAAPELAAYCLHEYPRANNPAPFELGPLTALFRAMRTGDLAAAFRAAPVSA